MARELDRTESAVRTWAEHVRADRPKGRAGLTTEALDDLRQLRKEFRTLRMEPEIPREPRPASPWTTCEVCVRG